MARPLSADVPLRAAVQRVVSALSSQGVPAAAAEKPVWAASTLQEVVSEPAGEDIRPARARQSALPEPVRFSVEVAQSFPWPLAIPFRSEATIPALALRRKRVGASAAGDEVVAEAGVIVSFPTCPERMSSPLPPRSLSFPAPPKMMSFPSPPWMMSFPLPAQMTSRSGVPAITSLAPVPLIVQSGCQSGPASENPPGWRGTMSDPSASMTKNTPVVQLAPASLSPSGERTAATSLVNGVFVRFVFVPLVRSRWKISLRGEGVACGIDLGVDESGAVVRE